MMKMDYLLAYCMEIFEVQFPDFLFTHPVPHSPHVYAVLMSRITNLIPDSSGTDSTSPFYVVTLDNGSKSNQKTWHVMTICFPSKFVPCASARWRCCECKQAALLAMFCKCVILNDWDSLIVARTCWMAWHLAPAWSGEPSRHNHLITYFWLVSAKSVLICWRTSYTAGDDNPTQLCQYFRGVGVYFICWPFMSPKPIFHFMLFV